MIGARTVLVIEPANDDRGGVADTLRRAAISVESAGDGARALAAIEAKPHAIVLVDPATPGLDAAMLVEALRGIAQRPVVLVMIDKVAPPRGFGADVIHGYVRRSTDGEQLAELIRDCLAALGGTGSQPGPSPGLSLRLPQ
jgi:CheY-like chemotaxis protein